MRIKIPDFTKGRVMVYGDVMLDRYWYGNTSRISPEAPVPVVHVNSIEECPGGAGNVVLNLKALGVDVKLFAACGDDQAAKALKEKFADEQIDCCLNVIDTIPTTTKLRVLSANQQLIRLDFEEKLAVCKQSDLHALCCDALPNYDVLILSDYNKGCLVDPQPLITAARSASTPVIVDPKQLDFSVYRHAYLVTPNFKEFCSVVGECLDENSIIEKGLNLANTHALEALLVTRGEQGMTLIKADGDVMTIPAYAREVFDVTGAGDTVIAMLAAAIAAGETVESATRLANTAASIVVGKLGAASISVKELRQAIEENHTRGIELHDVGVVSHPVLLEVVADAKRHGETVVLLAGIFDVLLNAHMQLLQQAKQYADRLIVVVMDDAFAHCVNYQPLHSLAARKSALAGMTDVDWVVDATIPTIAELCRQIAPNVLVNCSLTDSLMQPILLSTEGRIMTSEFDEIQEYQQLRCNILQKQQMFIE